MPPWSSSRSLQASASSGAVDIDGHLARGVVGQLAQPADVGHDHGHAGGKAVPDSGGRLTREGRPQLNGELHSFQPGEIDDRLDPSGDDESVRHAELLTEPPQLASQLDADGADEGENELRDGPSASCGESNARAGGAA